MKKLLVVAALASAAFAAPVMPAMAADAPAVEAKCYVFPLLPDCVQQWSDAWKEKGYHWTPIPNAWWTCKKAEDGSGHLLDCDADA